MTRPDARSLLRRARLELALAGLVALLFGDYLLSDKLLFGTDSIPGGLFFRQLLVDFVRSFHALPRWDPYILGGLPFLDATHGDTFFPSSLLQFAMPVYRALGHKLVLHVFLAGAFMAFYLRSLRLRPSAVALGAFAYMLCPIFVSYLYAGQDGKMYVTSLCPLVLALLERAMSSGSVRAFALLGVAVGLAILSAQIQMAYHLTWFLGALFVVRLVRGGVGPAPEGGTAGASRPGRIRLAGLFAGAIALGLLVAAIQLMPAVAFVKDPAGFSVRSTKTDYEHAASWSLHPEEVASMIVPEFCDAPRNYWGRNAFKLNSDYAGALVGFLALVALLRRRDATRIFLGGLAAFCVLYSLGPHTPLHRLFYAVVPQVKLFRAPPLVMFGAAFGLCALAAHAVHDLEEPRAARGGAKKSRTLEVGLVVAGAIALAGVAAGGVYSFWNDFSGAGLDAAHRQAQAAGTGAFRVAAFVVAVVLAAGTGILEAWRRGRLAKNVAMAGLLLLVVVDAWRVDQRFVAVVEPGQFIDPPPILAQLQSESRTEKFRVMPVVEGLQANEMGYFGIESVLGFHDNELAWYRALREEPQAKGLLATGPGGYPFLRILNVKYILHNQQGLANPYPVPGYLPRFRVVSGWEIQQETSRLCARLLAADFDPARSVLLEQDPGVPSVPAAADDAGKVGDVDYEGNAIRVRVDAARPCLLVQAENWFPYWHCTDETGRELPILRAYGSLRAIPLAAGTHTLTLRYVSRPYETGKKITLGALAAAVVLSVGVGRRRHGTPS